MVSASPHLKRSAPHLGVPGGSKSSVSMLVHGLIVVSTAGALAVGHDAYTWDGSNQNMLCPIYGSTSICSHTRVHDA